MIVDKISKLLRSALSKIYILQAVSNVGKTKKEKKGKGYRTSSRLNPYNPLSYLFLILAVSIGLLLVGVIGVYSYFNSDDGNPFKWN